MGDNTTASGNFTTAMGRNASTNGLSGSFVYGDATTSGIVNATAANSFTVRAAREKRGGSFGAAPHCIWPLHAPDLALVERHPYVREQ